jgi:hypothetical protein
LFVGDVVSPVVLADEVPCEGWVGFEPEEEERAGTDEEARCGAELFKGLFRPRLGAEVAYEVPLGFDPDKMSNADVEEAEEEGPKDSEEALESSESVDGGALAGARTMWFDSDKESADSSPIDAAETDNDEGAGVTEEDDDAFRRLFECFLDGLSLSCLSFGFVSKILPMNPPIFFETDAERPRLTFASPSWILTFLGVGDIPDAAERSVPERLLSDLEAEMMESIVARSSCCESTSFLPCLPLLSFLVRGLLGETRLASGSSVGRGGGGPLSRLACILASIDISEALLRWPILLSVSRTAPVAVGVEPELAGSTESRPLEAWYVAKSKTGI